MADGPRLARWVVVPCGRAKLTRPVPARQLYTGAHFQYVLRRVEWAFGAARVRILSARHGLVDPDTVLAPYDLTIDAPDAITAGQLARQLRDLAGANTRVTAYLPRAYLARLEAAADRLTPPVPVRDAYAGCRGIGDQRRVIANLTRE